MQYDSRHSQDIYAGEWQDFRGGSRNGPRGVHKPPRRRSASKAVLAVVTVLALLAAVVFGCMYAGAHSAFKKADASNQSYAGQAAELQQQLAEAQSSIAHYQEELGIPGGEPDTENMDSSQLASTLQQQLDHLNSKTADLRSQINALQPSSSATPTGGSADDGKKVAYLTFDDGPSANTEKILEVLKQYGAKATFFVCGTSKLELVKRIQEEGHTVALHCNEHDYSKVYASDEAYFQDLQTISDKVEAYLGFAPKIVRFPGGSSNTTSKKYSKGIMTRLTQSLTEKGYVYMDWNADSGDAAGNNVDPAKLVANVKRDCGKQKRVCILMHDAPAKTTTVTALPEIIQYLQGEGYSLEAMTTETKPFHHGVQN